MTQESSNRRVLITGAAGRIGTILREHLGQISSIELILLDLKSEKQLGIRSADLSHMDPEWTNLFAGVDTVIHLAADPRPTAPWSSISENNIIATLNVFRSAAAHKVRRIVYASSLQTMEGYRYQRQPITLEMTPRPTNWYAVSKLMGEAIAKFYSEDYDLSTVCLRIGNLQQKHVYSTKNTSRWTCTKFLIADDLCQCFEKAIFATQVKFAILPLVSDNPGMPWDLSQTCRLLGYSPTRTNLATSPAIKTRFRSALGWAHKRLFDPAWRDYWH